ncbi:protein CROC-4 [Heterocephalus glaber]|uniref:Protein CROC-4 n=1 Tax=Heterocephalus glaber TaxID=10181 RepID=A0AAX6S9F5_HETGA|nr:protein CROC-4 [Heterocephalus glaber]
MGRGSLRERAASGGTGSDEAPKCGSRKSPSLDPQLVTTEHNKVAWEEKATLVSSDCAGEERQACIWELPLPRQAPEDRGKFLTRAGAGGCPSTLPPSFLPVDDGAASSTADSSRGRSGCQGSPSSCHGPSQGRAERDGGKTRLTKPERSPEATCSPGDIPAPTTVSSRAPRPHYGIATTWTCMVPRSPGPWLSAQHWQEKFYSLTYSCLGKSFLMSNQDLHCYSTSSLTCGLTWLSGEVRKNLYLALATSGSLLDPRY